MAHDLVQLVYVSQATVAFTEPQLDELANRSAANNQGRGVTGLLVHHLGHFFQMLEGPREVVHDLYKKIERDERHTACEIIYEGATDQPALASWYMRNVSLTTATHEAFDRSVFASLKEAVNQGIKDRARAARVVRDFVRTVYLARDTAASVPRRDEAPTG